MSEADYSNIIHCLAEVCTYIHTYNYTCSTVCTRCYQLFYTIAFKPACKCNDHCSVLSVYAPEAAAGGKVGKCRVPTTVQGYLSHRGLECPLSKEAVTVVSLASAELFTSVQKVLGHSSLPGRQHYVFSLSHIASLFQVSLEESHA